MLRTLTIQNVVLIEKLEIDFSAGLCALTGETGAGKSILLDSLGLALGARAEARLVRKGADAAQVIAAFDINPTHKAFKTLKSADFAIEAGEGLILRRSLTADGRSKAFINDAPVGVNLLRAVGDSLVEIHGQFDTHGLMDAATHIGMLDDYAGLTDKAAQLKTLYRAWRGAENALAEAEKQAAALRAEEDYLRHVTDELVKLNAGKGEEAELAALKTALQNRGFVLEALNAAHGYLTAEGSADAMIQKAYRVMGRAEDKIGDKAGEVMEAMDRASIELQSARALIESMVMDLREQPHRLEDVDDRLYALRAAARKHDTTPDNLGAKLAELEAQLSRIEAQDDILSNLAAAARLAAAAYEKLALDISDARGKAAGKLDGEVMKELSPLKLDKARFVTNITEKPREQWNEEGIDRAEFLISTNPGADPAPLAKIASGGEMARFMLALKVVMARVGSAGTLIFDEADTGIGGAVADAVGERLARLAATHQVMVVTHSPQVAARASSHWIVHKNADAGGSVRTTITPLGTAQERREEIARMLSGAEITIEARAAADRLLELAA